ncbi:DUF898 family protein [Pseudovibrio sp. Tun.PSC04-5.I4]|uniref:DUF898 family protein n=1 Tax=Pseudovibrio sp. Tun.PSC04-5.I4 TaxID=1798213 RepID=UPI0008876C02|nr:DUF898 family protein [Pseudovibrio sp. Tun.PSC04-5.I4]SDR25355.1 protein of unknown function [Pseudovibrio sp. Tun.PSC04-5.I4]
MTSEAAPIDPVAPKKSFVRFSRGSFIAAVLKWVTLTVATLGIYRFWAMTGLRRSLWAATHVDGDNLRYHGTGKELFRGFLLAMAILIPFYALGFGLQFLGPVATIIGIGLMFVVGFLLTPYALFRRRRYLLTRTSWRGIRFHMQGSAWAYVRIWLFWTVLSVLTLGIALPWRFAKLDRFLANNSHFGNIKFSYTATPSQYFEALFPAYALAFVGYTVTALMAVSLTLGLIVGPIASLVLWPLVFARIFRLQANSTKIGGVSFESYIRASKFYGAYLIHSLLVSVGVGIVAAIGALILASLGLPGGGLKADEASFFNFATLAGIPFFALYYGVLFFANMMVLHVMLFQWKMTSLIVFNTHLLHDAIASGELENPVGMGLADALDAGFDLI